MSAVRKYSTICAVLLALYTLAGFVLLPFLIGHFGAKALRTHLSPESAITKVRINPFLLTLQVEGLATADAAGTWTAEWDVLSVDLSAQTLFEWCPVFERIALEGAAVSFDRELPGAEALKEITPEEASRGWREWMTQLNEMEIPKLQIDLLEVSRGQLTFRDHTNAEGFSQDIESIDFSFTNLKTDSEEPTVMQFSAETPRGVLIDWEGAIGTRPLSSEGRLSLKGLGLENLSPYYQQFTQFDLKRAVLGVSFEYVFDASDLDNLVSVDNTRVALTELLFETSGDNGRLLSIDEIVVEGGRFKFPQMELGIERIGISDGKTLIRRNADGTINLIGLVAVPGAVKAAEVQEDTADAAKESGFTYHVDLIEIINYQVSWEEDFAEEMASLAVTVPTLRVEHVSSDLEAPFTFFADYRIGDTGQIVLEGSVITAASKLDASVKVKDLALDVGAVYAKELGGLQLESGVLNFEGQASYDGTAGFSLDGSGGVASFVAEYGADLSARWETLTVEVSARFEEASGLSLTGVADLNGFAVKGGSGLEAQWNALALKGLSLTTNPMGVSLDSVSLDTPVMTVRNSAKASSESTELAETTDPVTEEDQGASEPLAVSVGSISVQQGALTFVDESVAPSATIFVTELTASVNHVDLASSTPVALEVSAKVNQSPFHLTGQLLPNDLKAGTMLQFQLSALSLPAFSSYTGQFVGRRISKGALSIDSDWTVKDSQLKASNKILVNQLKFGDRVESDSSLPLPLDLSVVLLAGPNGEMDISLPLYGDLSDPTASLGQIIRAAVVGLVTNIAAAPFELLSRLVGSDEDLSLVEFDAGESELSNEMLDRLNKMAEALKQRPELKLEIIPMTSPEDQVALTKLLLRVQVLGEEKLEDDKKFRKGVTKLYRKKMKAAGTPDRETDADTVEGLESMLAVILPDIELPDSESDRLATERSAAVSEHFVTSHGIEPARLNVAEAEPSDGTVGLRFDLK